MKKGNCKSTDLVCLQCGNIMTISRKEKKQKKVGHIKDMYCPYCKDKVKFFEVKDISIFKWICENNDKLTKEEQFVMNLLKEREELNDKSESGILKKVLTKK